MDAGQRIAKRFLIKEQAGAGGMGAVYRALDEKTGSPVAVKLLTLDEPASAERFVREAEVLAQISHPGVVGYIDHGIYSQKHYLVMEWVSGETLNRLLERAGITVAETLALGQAVAAALEELHGHSLVHRDIKPSNLILPSRMLAAAKLLDFGLVRRTMQTTGPTRTGLMVGSPGYMSPEQARGQRDVTSAVDVFSLGAVLYECLTGRAAFEGADALSIRSKVLMVNPPPAHTLNPEVSPMFSALVARMLSKNLSERPANGKELVPLLAQIPPPVASSKRSPVRGRFDVVTAHLEGMEITRSDAQIAPGLETQIVLLVGTEGEEHPPPPENIRHQITEQGGRVEVLESGQLLTVFRCLGDPQEEAGRVARLAIKVRATVPPEVPMTLVCDCSLEPNMEILIERGVRSIYQESLELVLEGALPLLEPRIRLDPQTEELLGRRFSIRKHAKASYLFA